MIERRNFRALYWEEKEREIEKGFVYVLQRQIQLDEKFSDTSNFKVVLNWYIRVVALNSTLRVYAQRLIRNDYPSIYQDPPQHITTEHFLNYCADTLSVLEQLKKSKREKWKLSTINAALDDIISQQQEIFNYIKTGNRWEKLFDTSKGVKITV